MNILNFFSYKLNKEINTDRTGKNKIVSVCTSSGL